MLLAGTGYRESKSSDNDDLSRKRFAIDVLLELSLVAVERAI